MVVDHAGRAVRRVGTGQDITKHTREQLVPFEATYAPGTWTSTTCTPQESVAQVWGEVTQETRAGRRVHMGSAPWSEPLSEGVKQVPEGRCFCRGRVVLRLEQGGGRD